jgi:hypothetical protein
VVESCPDGRRALALANCLSLVSHLVDRSIPFLCFYPSGAWLLMSVTSVLACTPPIADGTGNSLLMLVLEYGPVYLWLAYYCWTARKRRSAGVQEMGIPAVALQRYEAE